MADEDVEVVEQPADEELTQQGRHIVLEFTDTVDSGDKVG